MTAAKGNLRKSGSLSQMDAILIVCRVWECRQGEYAGDVRLPEDRFENQHDGAEPSVVPERLLP